MITLLRIVGGDIAADRRRSILFVAAITPIAAAYLILLAIAGGLRTDAVALEEENIVLVSPNALDPASGRLAPEVLEVARRIGGDQVASVEPMIFRPIRVDDRVVQLRAAPFDGWQSVHGLTLLDGTWPGDGDEVAITEGISVAAGWTVGTSVEIFGTTFRITALVRAAGTKFASVWMRYARADTLFEGRGGFQMVTVTPNRGADVRDLKLRLEQAAGADYAVYYATDLATEQGAREGAAKSLAVVATLIGATALAFGTFNLAALGLMERRRELGIVRTMGFAPRRVVAVALTRSGILALAGFAAGGLVAMIVLSTTAATTIRSFVFEPELSVLAWGVGVALTLASGLLGTAVALHTPLRRPIRSLVEAR